MTLLLKGLTPINPRLPCPVTLLFSRRPGGILLIYSRPLTGCNNNVSNHSVLISRQPQENEDVDTCKNIPFVPTG